MWKKGELVWVSLSFSDTWIPGRILDPSESLVSFFGLMEPRYVPKPCLRSFDRDFGNLISDSRRIRRFVNRALRAHFWNISFGLWCSCQPLIDSPYFDRENSLPWFPLTSDSALGFVRDMAISIRVPLWRLAETNSSSAQILSFRRYIVDFKRSKSVYEEAIESAELMDRSEESYWCLEYSKKMDLASMFPETADADVGNSRDLSLSDPLPKDIPCCASPSFVQRVDKVVQICTWKNPLTTSSSSTIKACETMVRTAVDDGHRSKSKESCQVEQSICLLNSEPPIEDMIEEDTTSVAATRVDVSEALPDVMVDTHDDIIGLVDGPVTSTKQLSPLLDVSNDNAYLAKPVSFVVPGACHTLACSMRNKYASPRNKLDSSIISTNTLNQQSLDMNSLNGTRENCSEDALESHIVEVGQVSLHSTGISNKEFSSDDVGIAPAAQVQDLEPGTTVENQTRSVDNVRSIGIKRKASRDKSSARNSKRMKKAAQQSIATDKPLNLHLMKDMRLANPKCLRMKFLSRHGDLPSKAELLKRFSVFGKIDASRTDVNPGESSAKVVFVQSIDAVTAYQFARSKKFRLGRSKVTYHLDPFEEDNEVNKVPLAQKPQKSVPSPKSCLKEQGSVDKEEGRRNMKVKFQMETNSGIR
ncbi:unnamed protein product [Arabidopsis lyrata]|uniref:Uncharacterized protein n=1 Tax=Arabidopsis lyrata subsp. lyrata TaxID=81972 RepID=D7KD28_ARALL|nr:uncharacterized protein LOC9330179 [Arabidopsis lyrata subsp. lyrata]EFH67702.1 hypothetical protein ARALYDRAFT_473993 [Arabidopsis lyrata subsp. lyrata]CAH8254927.1 unnamed protein product [Arabidopsis lyrata]|eukprot:XP_020870765.1 uncharacterized protein LOC9330179 [Arabidopsis lyrata subsp. lyrata]